jgi:hypothetical protein
MYLNVRQKDDFLSPHPRKYGHMLYDVFMLILLSLWLVYRVFMNEWVRWIQMAEHSLND